MKNASYAALTILIVTVLSSSIASGFSISLQPKIRFSVPASQGLQVWFDSPQFVSTPPCSYQLNAHAQTSNGWITSLHWDFGDGSTLDVPFSAQSVVSDIRTHIYSVAGTYSVAVTAYDSAGDTGSAGQTLTNVMPGSCDAPIGSAGEPAVSNAVIQEGTTSLQLPSGGQLYLYSFVTGGAYSSTSFTNGQYASVTNADGNLVASLAATTSDSNSFTTQTSHYSIGGVAISGYSSYIPSYASDSSPGSSGVSDRFTVTTSGSLVVVVALGGDEQCLNVTGLSDFSVDASNSGSAGQPNAITIGHAYLNANSYTVTEETKQCASGQDPKHAGNLIGVFIFQPGPGPPPPVLIITSVSTITATNTQTITITGRGFGKTPPQIMLLSDGSEDTYACNGSTPSLAILDSGNGKDGWSAGRETCSNTDTIGIFIISWSDTQIVLSGFGSSLGTNDAATWNIAEGDPLTVKVWGPNGNTPAQYQTNVVATIPPFVQPSSGCGSPTITAKLEQASSSSSLYDMIITITPQAGCVVAMSDSEAQAFEQAVGTSLYQQGFISSSSSQSSTQTSPTYLLSVEPSGFLDTNAITRAGDIYSWVESIPDLVGNVIDLGVPTTLELTGYQLTTQYICSNFETSSGTQCGLGSTTPTNVFAGAVNTYFNPFITAASNIGEGVISNRSPDWYVTNGNSVSDSYDPVFIVGPGQQLFMEITDLTIPSSLPTTFSIGSSVQGIDFESLTTTYLQTDQPTACYPLGENGSAPNEFADQSCIEFTTQSFAVDVTVSISTAYEVYEVLECPYASPLTLACYWAPEEYSTTVTNLAGG